ncbi:hypothetical protein GQ53DRAFT_698487 [Thozetella sp. PMI_491]|nr:hypothetical protein GQ53DRAFT_698487 [Thozetella sp. PMI_491]
MPIPLRSKLELDMWRLASAVRCENCGKRRLRDSQPTGDDPWRPGPGPDGVNAIWPFAAALCGSCVLAKAVKEIDLWMSATIPSSVLPALPFVFLTHELHVVPASTAEQERPPDDLRITKVFLSADVDEIQSELESVKLMGPGAFEEWLKGLEGRRAALLQEAAKWQRWEAAGGLRYPSPSQQPTTSDSTSSAPDSTVAGSDTAAAAAGSETPSSTPASRHPRSQQEAAMLKSARAAEIERRCQVLDPPLPASLLRHIPAFQAAIQITTPLDDCAWDVLKPRLLSQRAEAEKREQEATAEAKLPDGEAAEEPRRLESTLATTKEARDLVDKQWEEVQEPLRIRIVGYADDFVRDKWENGRKVSRENCSRFAAEALVNIRQRFYADTAKEVAAAKAAGKPLPADPSQGPFTQTLTLENMKWIFDSKIKPFTELYRKELFFCNACEGNTKAYGFEGVVQHYAAKHTSALSLGSIVVHWRAEWPEVPPFNPEGRNHKVSAPAQRSSGGYFGYQPMPAALPPQVPSYPPPSAPGYGPPPYGDMYHPPQQPQQYFPQGPYPPPSGYGQQPYTPQPGHYPPYPQPSMQNGPYPPPPTPDPSQAYTPSYTGQHPAPPPGPSVPGPYNSNYNAYQSNQQGNPPVPSTSGFSSQYSKQLEFIAKNSREVWQALTSIKDLPGSARVFATIHHVVKRYRSRFSETPPLSMFIDGLSNNKDMRPVRNINGLSCKACQLGLGNAASVEKEAHGVSFPKLANHFQNKHIELIQATQHMAPMDWVNDMVFLENQHVMPRLRSAVASDSQKSYLLADAFPEVFNQPLQAPAPYQQPMHTSFHTQGQPSGSQLPPSADNHDRFYANSASQSGQGGYNTPQDGYHVAPNPPPPQSHSYEPGLGDSGQEASRQKNFHQNHKRGGGKNKVGRNNRATSAARRLTEEEDKRAEEEARRQEDEIRAMWATDRATTARAATLSARPEDERPSRQPTAPNRGSQPSTNRTETPYQHRNLPSQKSTPRPGASEDEPNLMAALEMHLEKRHASPTPSIPRQPSETVAPYRSDPHVSRLVDHKPAASPLSGRFVPDGGRSTSPTQTEHYWRAQGPPQHRESRDLSGPPKQSPSTYYVAPRYGAREELAYERDVPVAANAYRQAAHQPDEQRYEPSAYGRYPAEQDRRDSAPEPRHPREDPHYSRGPPPSEHARYERASRPEYYRPLAEEARPLPRGAVQEFEIVQVIDDQGEYFIRRPVVRRQAESYYYEDRAVARREPEAYQCYEPVHHAPRPPAPVVYEHGPAPLPRSDPQPSWHRRESNTAPVNRADPAYYEPYDPHNPTAAVPVPSPRYQRQTLYYGDQ